MLCILYFFTRLSFFVFILDFFCLFFLISSRFFSFFYLFLFFSFLSLHSLQIGSPLLTTKMICSDCQYVFCYIHSNAHDFKLYPTCDEYDLSIQSEMKDSEILIGMIYLSPIISLISHLFIISSIISSHLLLIIVSIISSLSFIYYVIYHVISSISSIISPIHHLIYHLTDLSSHHIYLIYCIF